MQSKGLGLVTEVGVDRKVRPEELRLLVGRVVAIAPPTSGENGLSEACTSTRL